MKNLRKLLLSALVVGLVGVVVGGASWSAFSSTTSNPGSTFAAGTVALSDNDLDGTLVSLTDATPGNTATGCIRVRYDGSLDASVRLFATVSGSLGQYLTLKVTRGTDAGSFPTCSFNPDSRDYIGKGAGVVYEGNLSAFPSAYESGLTDLASATGLTETWSSAETHAYKLEVTLQNNTAAQGLSATASFTWEARNQ